VLAVIAAGPPIDARCAAFAMVPTGLFVLFMLLAS
jgi:hypothetical protein